jgi:hypothetical protein
MWRIVNTVQCPGINRNSARIRLTGLSNRSAPWLHFLQAALQIKSTILSVYYYYILLENFLNTQILIGEPCHLTTLPPCCYTSATNCRTCFCKNRSQSLFLEGFYIFTFINKTLQPSLSRMEPKV